MSVELREPVQSRSSGEGRPARGFGASPSYYAAHAEVQRAAAEGLVERISGLQGLPEGPVLEVGCGTGFVGQALPDLFPDRAVHLIDRSEGMVRHCRARFASRIGEAFTVDRADGEDLPLQAPLAAAPAVIVAGFVAQWFRDPVEGLLRLSGALAPGGALVASVPGAESFPEWRGACRRAGVPFSGLGLPEAEEIRSAFAGGPCEAHLEEIRYAERYPGPLHFFRHLRRMGASGGAAVPPLTPGRFRWLLRHWDEVEAEAAGTPDRGEDGETARAPAGGPERRGDGTGGRDIRVSYQVLFLTVRAPLRTPPPEATVP